MYKIIGADQKEYGPITEEQIRFWIREGRVNAQTKASADGTGDWKTLGAFPEFAEAFGLGTPGAGPAASFAPPPQAGGGREAALQAVKGPAIGLKVTAIIGLVMVALGLVMNMMSLSGHPLTFGLPQGENPQMQKMFNQIGGGFGILQGVVAAAIGVVVLMGASKMQSLTSYQFAFTAAILAMVPCLSPCCLLGLPFGIWALVVLNKPEIKSQFS